MVLSEPYSTIQKNSDELEGIGSSDQYRFGLMTPGHTHKFFNNMIQLTMKNISTEAINDAVSYLILELNMHNIYRT
jgi:hypothetical protein